jgi:hypothetical protein
MNVTRSVIVNLVEVWTTTAKVWTTTATAK